MSQIYQEETHGTWYYIDKKGRKQGWYGNEFAAETGYKDYLEEEELKDAEATRIPKESGGLLSGEEKRIPSDGSRIGQDNSKHDCEKECGSTCNCAG